jgi:DNA-binding CsgD family transcriptional regulator
VGREAEHALVSAKLSGGRGWLIVGDPGVGKTRLARSAIDAASSRGERTEWIAGAAGVSGVPLAAVAHLTPEVVSQREEPSYLVRTIAKGLSASRYTPLVIGVDDAHFLDAPSATVAHHALISGNASLIVTARRGMPLPEPIAVLERDGQLERLELAPLSDDAVRTLVRKVLDGPVDSGTEERLCAASQGNPMLVRELVHGGLEAGALARRGGLWSWEGPYIATRLRDLVDARLARLSPEERSGVELIASGEPLSVQVAEVLMGPDLVAALDRAGVLDSRKEAGQTLIRLAHPLYGEVLRATVSPLRQRSVYRRLAEAFAGVAALSDSDILRVVAWRLDSDEVNELDHVRRAARRALGASDFELAERIAWQGVDHWQDVESHVLVGFALAGQGRIDDAHQVLAAIASSRGGSLSPDLLTRALDLFFYGSRTTSAASAVQQVEQLIAGIDDWPEGTEPFVEAARAGMLVLSGSIFEAWEVSDRVLKSGKAPPSVELRVLLIAATMAAIAGRSSASLDYAQRGLALLTAGAAASSAATDALVELDLEPLMVAVSSLAQRISGDLDKARTVAQDGYRRYLSEDNRPARGLFALAAGQVELAAGHLVEAEHLFREAVSLLRRPPALYLVWALGCLGQVAAVFGDVSTADAALAEAEPQRSDAFKLFDCDVRQAEAWSLAARGDLSGGRRVALDAAAEAAAAGQLGFAAVAAHDAARLGAPAGASTLLAELVPKTDSASVAAFAGHARALLRGEPEALLDAARVFDELGHDLLAAEAFAEAAVAFQQQGRAQQRRAAAARTAALLDACGPVRTPALLALVEDGSRLTEREREIAELAASGMQSQAIASRLHISVRTVDNHLHRAYEKLGIGGREELGRVIPGSRRATP